MTPAMTGPTHSRLERLLLRLRPAAAVSVAKTAFGIRRREVKVQAGTFLVDPVSNLGAALIRTGEYESEMSERIVAQLRPGMTFVDVGANEGYFTVLASSVVGAGGRVVAIEPQSRAVEVLGANLALNRCLNVQVVKAAAGDVTGSLVLHLMPSPNTGATSAVRPVRYPVRTEKVAQTRIDDLLASLNILSVDAMKIDVEGYELRVINGARETFRSGTIACALVELHPRQLRALGSSPQDVVLSMKELGFSCSLSENSLWCTYGSTR
jgi:FkbM family methyltransferase